MDATRTIQIIVTRADMLLCSARVLPWRRMIASLLIAAAVIKVIKAVSNGE